MAKNRMLEEEEVEKTFAKEENYFNEHSQQPSQICGGLPAHGTWYIMHIRILMHL